MTWTNASIRAVAIFLYFVIATVWLPNTIMQLSFIADAGDFVRDAIVAGIWGVGLVAGIVLLRQGQKRSLI